ncbi:branched-chain amino acid ABC transporter permease [Azospirillum sp. A29]|jgi:branched-chain amino acid transport system permease protein|uniref:branched-chain amino acid ABC transporter permease n=1 Tax=Azospirillum sp. A29 TaxID=3160606 RepID=UPI0036703B07
MNASQNRRLYILLAVMAAGVLVAAPWLLSRYGTYILSMWCVMSIAAVGLNLTLGYAGQVSLAQGAFVGIGAYAAALLTGAGWPFLVALPAAVVLCFAIGWLLGYPALRVQHHYLAFVTLGFSTLVFLVLRNEEWLTNGVVGVVVERPTLFGLATDSPASFYYLCLAILGLVSTFTFGLIRSPWGRAFLALRENPVRALSLGVDTRRYTLMAFALGSALGGVAGSLYAPLLEFVDPTPFTLVLSFNLLLMVIVGGAGFFFGPFLGALIAVLLPEWLRFADGLYLILYATFVMALLAWSPSGILGILDRHLARRSAQAASAARAASVATLKEQAQ